MSNNILLEVIHNVVVEEEIGALDRFLEFVFLA